MAVSTEVDCSNFMLVKIATQKAAGTSRKLFALLNESGSHSSWPVTPRRRTIIAEKINWTTMSVPGN